MDGTVGSPAVQTARRHGGRSVTDPVDEIADLFRRFGGDGYGECLSLERHMLQTAAMARSAGATDSLVAAALLHDIGYFVAAEEAARSPDPAVADLGAGHEALGAIWLSGRFPEAVTAPVALHVEAKRYLCCADPAYHDVLSEASRLSLARQGGPMTTAEAAAFRAHPAFEAALLLRQWDDSGKDLHTTTPGLKSYDGVLRSVLRR